MALFDDLFKGGNIVAGLAIGIGAALVAPVVIPALRPIAKSIIKAGLIAYDQGRLALADLSEHSGDILAEVRTELAEATKPAPDESGAAQQPSGRERTRPSKT
jgi:hypothetical protein